MPKESLKILFIGPKESGKSTVILKCIVKFVMKLIFHFFIL